MVPFFYSSSAGLHTKTQRAISFIYLSKLTLLFLVSYCAALKPSSNTNPPTNLNVTLNDQTRLEDSKFKLLPTDSGV